MPTAGKRTTGKPAGIYLVEIKDAKDEISKSAGDQMITLALHDVKTGDYLCHDRIMMGGKGENIGLDKLEVLGIGEGDSFETGSLVGKRIWVSCEERDWNNEKQLQVDISAKGSQAGFWPEGKPPEGAKPAKPTDDDIPF